MAGGRAGYNVLYSFLPDPLPICKLFDWVGFVVWSEPGGALSLLPLALFSLTWGGRVDPYTMLLTIFPLSLILAAVGPQERSLTFLLIINVVTFVLATVRPLEDAVALHLIIAPHALVFTTIRPIVYSYSKRKVTSRSHKALTDTFQSNHDSTVLSEILIESSSPKASRGLPPGYLP